MSMQPIQTRDIERPPKELIDALSHVGSATASGELFKLGIRDPQILGPLPRTPGRSVCGPALTLQFMPKREDLHASGEYQGPERQLHRHALYHTQPGDVIVVDARGNMSSGVFGEMMLTYFCGQGGQGAVIDGCIRDFPHARELDLGLWLKGANAQFSRADRYFSLCRERARRMWGHAGHARGYRHRGMTMARWWCRSSSRPS